MKTPWEQASAARRAKRHEERIGKLPGGKKQINSGRVWFSRRDNTLHGFLIEARHTSADSYRIERKEFEQITQQAVTTPPGLLPGLMPDINGLRLIVIREDDFIYMQEYIGALEGRISAGNDATE